MNNILLIVLLPLILCITLIAVAFCVRKILSGSKYLYLLHAFNSWNVGDYIKARRYMKLPIFLGCKQWQVFLLAAQIEKSLGNDLKANQYIDEAKHIAPSEMNAIKSYDQYVMEHFISFLFSEM